MYNNNWFLELLLCCKPSLSGESFYAAPLNTSRRDLHASNLCSNRPSVRITILHLSGFLYALSVEYQCFPKKKTNTTEIVIYTHFCLLPMILHILFTRRETGTHFKNFQTFTRGSLIHKKKFDCHIVGT